MNGFAGMVASRATGRLRTVAAARFLGVLLVGWLVTGCRSAVEPPPTPAPTTVAALPSATPIPATATPVPTLLPPPTVLPPATPTAQPTVAAEPTDMPAPTATPAPVTLLTLDDFVAAGRNRFTGEPLAEADGRHRPIVCKISNWPAEHVRPQSGIGSADIIFEHFAEGVTRFSGLFYGTVPPKIGPIRSGRLIDIELATMFDAMLCFSGSNQGVRGQLVQAIGDQLLSTQDPGYYRTDDDKPYEHTLFMNLAELYPDLDRRDKNHPPEIDTQLAFASATPPDGSDTPYVAIDYGEMFAEWRWDAEAGRYLRWGEGVPVVDANDDRQLAVSNVVLLFAYHRWEYEICPDQSDIDCRAGSLRIQLWDKGDVVVLRDGQRFNGEWVREEGGGMFELFDTDGNPLPLQIGRTFVQVIPYFFDNPVSYDEP